MDDEEYTDPLHGVQPAPAPCRRPDVRDYWESVQEAVRWVYGPGYGTGGARALAQALLGCYNGTDYRVDLVDIASLDDERFLLALDVIRLRWHGIEPHKAFTNGDAVFGALADKYGHLFPGQERT